MVLGFELRASCLLGRYSPLEPQPQPFFALVIFQIGSCDCVGQPQTTILLPPHSWDYRYDHHTTLFVDFQVTELLCIWEMSRSELSF
jgi:hypothetical protein